MPCSFDILTETLASVEKEEHTKARGKRWWRRR